MSYDLGLCGTPMRGIYYFIAEQYWEVSVQATASGTPLCKTLLDCKGMEGSSSISFLGHWTMEAWVMNWVIWYIYEWCLLCHGGAVLRGGRKPIAAWWPPSSTSGSMTGPQWNRRSSFHFPQLSHLDWWSMSMKVGCMDCDTCLLTLKASAGPCMVYANSFNRCFDLIWRCYCWWCRSYRIVSYRRIPF